MRRARIPLMSTCRGTMKTFLLMSLLVFSITSFAQTEQKRVLRDPNGETVFWMFYHLAEIQPDLAPIIKQRMLGESGVNEFNRTEKEKVHEERLKTEFAAAAHYTHIELNLRSYVSAYDAAYHEFYFNGLGPGSYISFAGYGKQFKISLINAEEASVWSVPPDKAETIAGLMGPSRQVSLRLYLKILGATPDSSGGEIEAKIMNFKIYAMQYNRFSGRKVGEIVLVE